MKNLFVVFSFLIVLFVGFDKIQIAKADENSTAKCRMPKFKTEYKNSKAVFVGKVIVIKKVGNKRIFEFKVKKFWKGIKDTKVWISVNENKRYQASYKDGESYLVFAKGDKKSRLWDARCSRSRNINGYSPSLKEDLEALGKGKMVKVKRNR